MGQAFETWTFDGNEGNRVIRFPSSNLDIVGGATTVGTYSGANLKTVAVPGDDPFNPEVGSIQLQLADAPVFAGQVTANGFDANGNKIVNVAAGTADTDAVNVSQLNAVNSVANAGWNVQTNGDAITNVTPGATVQFLDGQNIELTRDGTNITVATTPDLTADSLTINDGPVINNEGITMNAGDTLNMGGNKITNVAAGTNGTDAVNVEQVKQLESNMNNQIAGVKNDVRKLDDRLSGGVAAAMATATLPQAYLPGKSMFSVGGATWRGQSGVAVGLSTISDNGKWVLKGSANSSSRGDFGAAVGVGYQW
ncbi:YadA-like C-terminal domain-containing protein 2 (plasmid) [Advenella kashmirensis WT001]|uniref:YadA-like C-terminal domain-containing protein 2 n=2 Tax=Advenella kashmirensis TaxID=310575 RepID=I3UHX4_ADVKW|nr:YadA-like C-terminal domain-containing protein 2 [Advenella kashmirensis WT001]